MSAYLVYYELLDEDSSDEDLERLLSGYDVHWSPMYWTWIISTERKGRRQAKKILRKLQEREDYGRQICVFKLGQDFAIHNCSDAEKDWLDYFLTPYSIRESLEAAEDAKETRP